MPDKTRNLWLVIFANKEMCLSPFCFQKGNKCGGVVGRSFHFLYADTNFAFLIKEASMVQIN